MKVLHVIFLLIPIIGQSQISDKENGIQFSRGLSLDEIRQKAKKENKHIFIDCFTTWCGPCNMMDSQVFQKEKVGNFFNAHFVSIKMQMDRTAKDGELIKQGYSDAKIIAEKFRVNGYPTYLFFSPDGVMVHRDGGAILDQEQFIELGREAILPGKVFLDPYESYSHLVDNFRKGHIKYDSLIFMANKAKELGDTTFWRLLFRTHLDSSIKMPPHQRYTKLNLEFWANIPVSTKSKVFTFFYKDAKLINDSMGELFYAEEIADKIIQQEIVFPFLEKDASKANLKTPLSGMVLNGNGEYTGEANWKKIYHAVKKRFGSHFAERSVINAQINWYKRNNNIISFVKASLKKIEKYPLRSITRRNQYMINEVAWKAFLSIEDKLLLETTIRWAKKSVDELPSYFTVDTYANLLYKIGQKEEAIKWEKTALELFPNNVVLENTLSDMINGRWTHNVKPLK